MPNNLYGFTFCLVILHAVKCVTNIQLQDVAAFLEEMETTEVLLDSVLKSQNSRVTVSAQRNIQYFPLRGIHLYYGNIIYHVLSSRKCDNKWVLM